VNGILEAYRGTLPQIGLGGPTNFSPVIEAFTNFAAANQAAFKYQILLIITDGMITDMQQTINSIVRCSRLPTSIIIVGVGNADFSSMEQLDGDDGLLRDQFGQTASRDIVQFVRFLDCQRMGNLAQEVLKEVPEQVCLFMEQTGFKPVKQMVDMSQFDNPILNQSTVGATTTGQ
jgi:hypothetical protein